MDERGARPPRLWAEIAKWAIGRPSILALSPSLIHVFWKSDPALDSPDLQFTFTPASYKAGGIAGMLDSFQAGAHVNGSFLLAQKLRQPHGCVTARELRAICGHHLRINDPHTGITRC